MNILIVNPILYTSETADIKKIESIKDTMIYDFCLAFHEKEHKVTLYAAENFKPIGEETYPFEIIWGRTVFTKIFKPNCIPFIPKLTQFIFCNRNKYDFIVSSEVFSLCTFQLVLLKRKQLIIWHELAKHNRKLHKIPSHFWYNIIARRLFKNILIVPRSIEAEEFISKYCTNVIIEPIDHGVNLTKFQASYKKDNIFIVSSQLISRKRIDGIIRNFYQYIQQTKRNDMLLIAGEGDQEFELKQLSTTLGINKYVTFLGKLPHCRLVPLLAKAKALLINTSKDNNLISVVEAIAVGTPIITTEVPHNAQYIKKYNLGCAKDGWDYNDIIDIADNNELYIRNCLEYRDNLSTEFRVKQFISIYTDYLDNTI